MVILDETEAAWELNRLPNILLIFLKFVSNVLILFYLIFTFTKKGGIPEAQFWWKIREIDYKKVKIIKQREENLLFLSYISKPIEEVFLTLALATFGLDDCLLWAVLCTAGCPAA